MEILQKDVNEHKALTQRMVDSLDAIRLEISGAKGFLKAIVIGAVVIVSLVTGLFAVHWIQVPTVQTTIQLK